MNEIEARSEVDRAGFCFRMTGSGVVACSLPELPRATSGPIRVSRLGRIYTWNDQNTDVGESLAALAKCIELQGIPAALQQLDGEWMLIVEDRSANTTSFVTDHRGTHPIYTLTGKGGMYIASSMSTICKHACADLDEGRVAIFLSRGDKDLGQPLYTGSQRIGPGQIITIDQSGKLKQEKWLIWNDKENYKPDLKKIKTLLFDAVINNARHLAKPISGTLSGGIDSTTVCIALSGTPEFRSYSVDAGPVVDNEKKEINETLRITKMKHSYVPASFEIDELKNLLFVSGEPIRGLKTISTLYSCAKSVRQDGGKSMVLGWGPDTYFLWGTQMQVLQYMHFLVTNLFLRTLIRSVPQLSKYYGGGAWKMFRDYALSEANAFKNKGNIVFKGKPYRGHHLKKEYARAHPFMRPINLKKWTMQMLTGTVLFPSARAIEKLTGVEVAAPFFSLHLTQYVLGCESRHMMIDGHTKAMMRKALEDVVPPHVAWPPVKKNIPYRPMEEIVFDSNSTTTVEAAITSSRILQRMINKDSIVAFRSDREINSNADFWLRCIQVAFLEQLGSSSVRG